MSRQTMNLPVYRAPAKPEESGSYVCKLRGEPRVLVLHWCVEAGQTDWRHGAMRVEVSQFAGPIRFDRPL